MSISDDFIKKVLGGNPKNQTNSVQQSPKTAGNSIADDFIRRHNYDVDESFINTFISDANRFMSSANDDYSNVGWGNASSYYKNRRSEWTDLNYRRGIVQGWLEYNKDRIDENFYKDFSTSLDGIGTGGADIVGAFSEAKDIYSKYKSQEEYDYYLARSTKEGRQKLYADTQAKLDALKAERNAMRNSSSRNAYLTGGSTLPSTPYAAAHQGGETGRLGEIDKEIKALEMELAKYERGLDGYTSKVVDDYSGYTERADFDAVSANRAFVNPTRGDLIEYDAMSDSSTWYFDADGTYRDAFGNKLEVDESGNWFNPNAGKYQITDRLGMYLSASESEILEAAGTTAGTEGAWATVIKDGIDGNWDQLEKGEISIYYYLLNSNGQQAADKYLADMKTELNRRSTEENTTLYTKAVEEANALEKLALSIATTPAQFISGAAGFIEDTANVLMGNDINPYSAAHSGMNFSNTIRSEQANAWDKATGGIAIPFIDFTAGDLYQAGMSAVDMFVGGKLGAGAYEAIMGMSSASSEAKRLYEQGATTGQIAWGAALAGGAEMIFEHASIENLIKMKDAKTVGQFVKNALIQGGIEASEEGFTEIANTITNAIVMGDESDWAKLVEEHNGDWLAALIVKTQEVGSAAFSGFVSGGMGGVTHSAADYAHNKAQMRSDGKTILGVNGGLDSLQQLANDVAGVSSAKMQKGITKQTGKVAKKATAGRVGYLYDMVKTAVSQGNAADIAKSLKRNHFSAKTANDIAEALAANFSGQRLTEAQERLLKSVENSTVVLDAISNIILNPKSTMGQRNKNIRDFNNGVYRSVVLDAVTKSSVEKEFTPEGKYEVSDIKKAVRTDTNEEIDIKGVASVSKDKLMLELADGQTIDAKSVSFANDADALVYEAVARLGDNINAETANKLISQYNGGNAMVFARGMAQAYTWGFHGFDKAELSGKSALTSKLTQEQIDAAYAMGEQYRPVKDMADKAKARATKAPAEKGVYYRDKDGNATDIETYMKENGKNLNARQKTAVEVMRKFSAMMGARFNVFESWVENGKHYYLDENGKVVEGNPNGFYDTTTGEIYIALDAGAVEANGFRDTMLFTIAHEMTHFMRQWSPEHFTKISKIIFQQAGFKGRMSELVTLKQAERKAKGKPISYDTAVEEVVADAMETILKDGKVVEFMAEVKQKDHTAWQKLKGWFKNLEKFLRKLVTAYRYETANTIEGDAVSKFAEDMIRQIQQIWAEGAVEAGENYQAADGYKAEQEQMSTDTIRGSADGAVVQSEVTEAIAESKQQIRTEFEALPKQVMNLSDGAGTILGFIDGLKAKEVKGIAGKSINGYTGRDVRGWAMNINGFTKADIKRVNEFMDTMADFMEKAGMTYKFIGLEDVHDAKLHYTYNADGSIKSIVLSAMVKNGDYPVNFDLSSICKKRVAMSKLIDKLAQRGSLDNGTVKLTPANIFKINTALKDEGYETACLGCFVESKRYNSLEWAKKFCNKWNAAVKKVNPNATYFGYGDASFTDDSFTLEQAVKVDDAANKYIKATKTERLANALKKYQEKEQAGQPLVAGKVMMVDGVELNTFSKAARDRLAKSDTISDELKSKYLNCDVSTLNMADVEFLLENGILPGAALTNKQAVTEMVKSGEAYQHLLRPSDLLTDRGISKLEALPNFHGVLYGHYGSGTPKLMQSYTPYNSEIALLPTKKGDLTLAEYLYTIAGVRMQSFSDFQIQNIYDYLQMVGDLAARKLPAHAYTKEISFAKLLGMTGIKVNLSVMFDIDPMVDKAHAGLTKLNKLVHRGEYAKVVLEDAQGKWVYNIGDYQTQKLFAEAYPDEAKRFLQSIGFGDAVKLQSSPGYSANCGIIGVGYSDLGIFAMLNDNRIRYIIPYHASSLPAEIKVATNIALGTDYTPYQNNMKIKEIVDRNGNKVNWTIKEAYKRLGSGQAVINELNEKIRTEGWVVSTSKAQTGHGSYGLYEDLQQTNDPRQTASNFMDWCIGNSTLPLFYQFASHENYYKLLYDYNVYDCVTEEYAPQQAVTNTYPTMVDGQVQPGNVTDGGFDAEYFKGAIDKQMAFMDEYSRNLDEDLDALAENMENGTLFSDRDSDIKLSDRDESAYKQFFSKVNSIINQAIEGKGNIGGKIRVVDIMQVGPKLAAMVAKSSGGSIEISHRNIALNTGDVWHEYKRHTSVGEEVSRDQVAFTKRQFQNAVKCMLSPDMVETIFADTNNPTQRQSFAYAKKTVRGHYVVVEAVGGKKNPSIYPVMILQFSKSKWKKMMEQGKTLGEILFESDAKKLNALDVAKNKKSRVTAAQFASYEAIANTLRSPQLDDMVSQPDGDVKRSDRDTTYLDAVNRGDMKTAQRMVDEAAEKWSEGNEIYVTDPETGEVQFKFYRSADAGRTVWDGHGNNQAQGVFLTSNEFIANAFDPDGKHITVYAKAKNPFVIDARGRGYTRIQVDEGAVPDWLYEISSTDWDWSDQSNDYVYFDSVDIDNLYPEAFKQGYDAVIVTNVVEGVGGGAATDIVLKDGGVQMKSADPVTYDDKGNVIPLSERFNPKNDDIRYSDRILMGSLFSGGGTLEAGLVYQMLDKQFGVEYDAKIASVYANNHGDHIQVGKVEDFDISKYDDIFYLHASPVCHNFSKAKHGAKELQMDINSAKATAKHLETAMPQVFTVENAPGYRKSESLKIITDKLTELGYKWDVDVYNSADYGSATSRNRVILRAVKDGELPPKPEKQERTNSWDKATRDLWGTLPKSYLRPSFISAIENTRNLPILDSNGKVNVNKPLLILTTTSGHTVTYCWEGDICPTLTTKCGEARLVMPDGNIYAVTPEFMGRIQGLPDNYQYPKEKTRAFTIIGNGIPTHLTKAVVGGVLDSAYEQTHDGQALYQDRAEDSVSNRALLANAFEGIAKPEELQKIQEYKDKVSLINAEEKKLRDLRAQIKELSFAKGSRDTKKIAALRDEATKTANRIGIYDSQLLRLEASQPLQDVLEREKKKSYDRAKKKGEDALEKYKEAVKAGQRETVEKWRESRKTAVAKARETAEKRDARAKLQKLVLDTVKWISYPAKTDVKCPDILKKPYKDFLDGIDLSSKRLANGGEATNNDLRLANAMDSLATAIDRVMLSQDPNQDVDKVLDIGYLDLPADFVQKLRDMTEAIKSMMVEGEYVVNTMTASEVKKLSQMIRTLNHAIKTMSKLYANLRFANVEALGFDTMDFLDIIGEIEKAGGMKDFVQWDNALPYYAFKRFGKGGESVFEGLMDAQDKLAFLAQKIFDFQEKTWTAKEAKAWSEDTHTITLPNGNELTLTTADAMSIYCLSRREQGIQHLLGGGVRVMGIQKGSTKVKDSRSLLTIEDIDAIVSSLTDRQKKVAEGIQEFMSTVCSDWGNEISMKRFLTREFTEKFYFPIESNDENLTTRDPAAQQSDLFRLLNISATKPLTQGANNEVIIRNIFDVFTGHASDMARLNAYGMGLLDYMKWLNYRERSVNDEGQVNVKGVRKSIEKAYGNAANSYILNLIKDVNGRASDGGEPTILMKWMRAGKTASVGSSLRVATLQITSYPRASLVLSPKSLALGLSKLPNINRAKKYCGIALWKSFGFYDTNISRSIEDQMKGVKDVKQKLIELSLKGAELGDAITWGALWNACEYEVAAGKKFKVGTEEFYQEVGKKLREVVYRTQVVDSTLTRSQMMRSKRGMAQEASAFMSEPTLSANILMDAGFEFGLEKRRTGSVKSAWKKTGTYIGRSVAVYSIGQLTAALMEALWDAWRDDEDEEFIYKYLSAFVENLALDLVPFNKIPIVSDVFEAVLSMLGIGYFSSDKMSTTWLTQAVSAVDAWKDVISGKSSATIYNALYKSVRAISSFYGVSFSGVMREAVALWNNTAGAYDVTLKILTYDRSKAELGGLLLDAILEDDDRQADSLRDEFEDENAYQSAIRTAIKDRYEAGEIDQNTALQYLVKYGGIEEDDAYWKVEEWEYESETGEDFGKYDDLYTAVQTGKNLKATIKRYTDNGVPTDTLSRQITSHFKPMYIGMSESEKANIKGYLLNAYEQCGVDRDKAADKIAEWEFEADHPELQDRITYTQYKRWQADGKPNGVSIELFTKVAEYRDDDTSDSVKSQDDVEAYIRSVTSDRNLRHALWCCFYKASTSPFK